MMALNAGPTALAILRYHRQQVELSPGVGEKVQTYALAVCDDVERDFLKTLRGSALSGTVPTSRERMEQVHQAFDAWLKKVDPLNLFVTCHGFAREAWQDATLNAAPQDQSRETLSVPAVAAPDNALVAQSLERSLIKRGAEGSRSSECTQSFFSDKWEKLCPVDGFNIRWLSPGAICPVDIPTTGVLLREIVRLRDELLKSLSSARVPSEAAVEAAAKVISESSLIDAPRLPFPAWMGLARAVLESQYVNCPTPKDK